jgi:hypothetical protein
MGWVSREDSQRGSAQVYVDGTWVATVSTYASSTVDRAVAYAKTFSSRGTHTLKIVNAGTSGHSKLGVDAFAGL